MRFYALVEEVISSYIFPKMNTADRDVIIKCVNDVIENINKYNNLSNIYNQLTINSYRDIYVIVNMILPFIEEIKKKDLQSLKDITNTQFTNLKYNLGEDYEFSTNDVMRLTDYLINTTLPKVINKLYVNWIDILPDTSNNDGFHSIIKLVPDIYNGSDREIIYNHIEDNIKSKRSEYDEATYFFLNSEDDPIKYKDTTLLDEFSDLSKHPKQNWFEAETFNWLSQIHFFNHVLSNRIIYLSAGTGVGKSTHIPKLALYSLMAFENVKEPKIIITQPRQIPTEDNPKYISINMGKSIERFNDKKKKDKKFIEKNEDYYIQYQHGNSKHIKLDKTKEKNKDNHRSIKYVTDQILFNELLENPSLIDKKSKKTIYDIIMIDEAHEHNIRMDMILSLLSKTLQENKQIKVFIISATMEDDEYRYRQFYNNIIDDKLSTKHLVDRRLHIANPLQKNRFIIKEYFEKQPVENYIEKGIEKVKKILNTSTKGDILFFLPGTFEINKVCEELNKDLPQYVISLPLYSELEEIRQKYAKDYLAKDIKLNRNTVLLPLSEQTKNNSNRYTRKVIIATSIAEASVTIKNLVFVIDIGFSKSIIYNPTKKLPILSSVPISFSSHTQRRGRAGRTAPGEAYYLYTKDDIKDNKIIPDITKNDLINDIFQLLKRDPLETKGFEKKEIEDLDGSFHIIHPQDDSSDINRKREINSGLFKTPLQPNENLLINDSFEHLQELKLITSDGYYSDLGKFITLLNAELGKLSLFNKIALINSIQCKYDEYIIPILAFQSQSYNTFFTDIVKGMSLFGNKFGDHITILNMYTKFKKSYPGLYITLHVKSTTESEEDQKKYNIEQKYFSKYNINSTGLEKDHKKDINKIFDIEKNIIRNWCKTNFINIDRLIRFLDNIAQIKYYKFKIIEKLQDLQIIQKLQILQEFPLKTYNFKELQKLQKLQDFPLKNYKSQELQELQKIQEFPLKKYKLKSSNLYNNIITILKDSNPRNTAFINKRGIYQTRFGTELNIKSIYLPKIKKKIALTTYNKYSNQIYFSNIRNFDTNTEIDQVSALY